MIITIASAIFNMMYDVHSTQTKLKTKSLTVHCFILLSEHVSRPTTSTMEPSRPEQQVCVGWTVHQSLLNCSANFNSPLGPFGLSSPTEPWVDWQKTGDFPYVYTKITGWLHKLNGCKDIYWCFLNSIAEEALRSHCIKFNFDVLQGFLQTIWNIVIWNTWRGASSHNQVIAMSDSSGW